MKNVHFKIFKMIATSGFLTAVECTKSRRSPRPLVGWGGGHPLDPITHPPRRLRRLGLVACGDSSSAPSALRSQNPLRYFFLDTALGIQGHFYTQRHKYKYRLVFLTYTYLVTNLFALICLLTAPPTAATPRDYHVPRYFSRNVPGA